MRARDVLLGFVFFAVLEALARSYAPAPAPEADCLDFPASLCVTPAGYIGEPACTGDVCECAPIKLEER